MNQTQTQTVTGSPYWTQTSAVPTQYPYLTENIDCDVAIVGGGITGALCAYFLQKAGVDTVLIDSGLLGYGGTSVSPAMLQYEVDYSLSELSEYVGTEKAVRLFRACGRGIDLIQRTVGELGADVGFARRDCFYYTPDERSVKDMRDEFLLRRHHDFQVELIESMAATELFSFRVEAGIYTPNLGGEINPYKFLHALLDNAVQKGLRVYENTVIDTATADNSGILLESNTRNTVRAKKMINATGLKAAKELGNLISLHSSFCLVTEPVNSFQGWHNRCIIRDDDIPFTYMHTTEDNRILIGGLDSTLIDAKGNFAHMFRLPGLVERKYDILEKRLLSMFTGIGNLRAAYRFAGVYGDTCDGLPYFGECEKFPNVLFDICTGANGIVFAALGAEIISDLYLGKCPQDYDLFQFDR